MAKVVPVWAKECMKVMADRDMTKRQLANMLYDLGFDV